MISGLPPAQEIGVLCRPFRYRRWSPQRPEAPSDRPFSQSARREARNVGSASQPASSKSGINTRYQVFPVRLLTMFLFCCLQFCRLSFFPYVIKLALKAESSMGGGLAKKSKKSADALVETRRPVGELNLSACEARRLYGICVELLELCSHVSGRIDPQAGWMVAHARDEVMLGIFDVKP